MRNIRILLLPVIQDKIVVISALELLLYDERCCRTPQQLGKFPDENSLQDAESERRC